MSVPTIDDSSYRALENETLLLIIHDSVSPPNPRHLDEQSSRSLDPPCPYLPEHGIEECPLKNDVPDNVHTLVSIVTKFSPVSTEDLKDTYYTYHESVAKDLEAGVAQPIQCWPGTNIRQPDILHRAKHDIIIDYFAAIKRKHVDAVRLFIQMKFVTANTTGISGDTTLLAAVSVQSRIMIEELIGLGAEPDAYGIEGFSRNSHQ